ncbi:ribose ABC transporter permease [bacterium]|nr:ribose ABC transporter permease [bacterium]
MKQRSFSISLRHFLAKASTFLILIFICFLFFLLERATSSNPRFLTLDNISNVLRQVSVYAILAVGETFVILTGGIDLSVGSVLALCGAISAGLALSSNLMIALLAGMVLGAAIGAIQGIIIAKGGVPPFVATLGTMAIARSLTLVYTKGALISPLPQGFQFLGSGYFLHPLFSVPVLITLFIYILAYIVLSRTAFGRRIYAIGGNEEASRLSGVNVSRYKVYIYAISGLTAGLGGLVMTARLNCAHPQAGLGYELDAIAAVVIGGTSLMGGEGGVGGTLIGAIIMGVLNNGLNLLEVNPFWQQAVVGSLIIIAVLLDRLRRRRLG